MSIHCFIPLPAFMFQGMFFTFDATSFFNKVGNGFSWLLLFAWQMTGKIYYGFLVFSEIKTNNCFAFFSPVWHDSRFENSCCSG